MLSELSMPATLDDLRPHKATARTRADGEPYPSTYTIALLYCLCGAANKLGMNQTELAKEMGVSPNRFASLKSGRDVPSPEEMRAVVALQNAMLRKLQEAGLVGSTITEWTDEKVDELYRKDLKRRQSWNGREYKPYNRASKAAAKAAPVVAFVDEGNDISELSSLGTLLPTAELPSATDKSHELVCKLFNVPDDRPLVTCRGAINLNDLVAAIAQLLTEDRKASGVI